MTIISQSLRVISTGAFYGGITAIFRFSTASVSILSGPYLIAVLGIAEAIFKKIPEHPVKDFSLLTVLAIAPLSLCAFSLFSVPMSIATAYKISAFLYTGFLCDIYVNDYLKRTQAAHKEYLSQRYVE